MAFNSNIFQNMPPVTKNLILINILIYLVQAIAPASKEAMLNHYLALHYFTSPDFNPAQVVTYMFMHGGFTHLFFNMFALFMFGSQIEYSLGSKRFLFYYISCGIGAALIQEGVFAIMLQKYYNMLPAEEMDMVIRDGCAALRDHKNFINPTYAAINSLVNTPIVGASGAIYGVLLAFGMLFPNAQIMLIIPPMPLKAKWMVVGYAVIELLLGVGGADDGIAHFCHLGGMLVGFLIILYWKKKGTFHGFYN